LNANAPSASTADAESRTYRKVAWRLIPFLFLCYVVAYLDRVNVGFAKLQMLSDLKFSETAYGLGAGIFFIGYFLFEIPSNLILHRTGARRWIARIMITWGFLSATMMFVRSEPMFYLLRFLLGAAEAGFFPGIILYLTYWFPAQRRGRIVALFMTAIAMSGVVGGPLSGWIMTAFAGVNGWAGWQWLFLLEGLPAVLIGVTVLFYLDDSIDAAGWLQPSEKALLKAAIAKDNTGKVHLSVGQTLRDPRVLLLSALYFCFIMGLYGVSFWLPQLIKGLGVKGLMDIGLLSAIPYGVAAIAMVAVGRSSDLSAERRWHLIVPALVGAIGLVLAGVFGSTPLLGMAALTLGTVGVLSTLPVFWTLPTALLGGSAAAAGIALINSVGNLAGFLSPYMVGAIKDATGQTTLGLYCLAASMVLGAILALLATRGGQRPTPRSPTRLGVLRA
jgi:D-galactonate transporter